MLPQTLKRRHRLVMETQAPQHAPVRQRQPHDPATIIARDLCKVYHDGPEEIRAVDGVSFTCYPRQLVAISGPSGCGKSTLLYLLGSLDRATSGQLEIAGVEVTTLAGQAVNQFRRHKVGFVFQSFHLVPNLSALENVLLPMDLAGVPVAARSPRARDLLLQVGIDEQRHHHLPSKLSGGQQQRVAIARALANEPALV